MNSARNRNIGPKEWATVRELMDVLENQTKSVRFKYYLQQQVPKEIFDEVEALLSGLDSVGTFLEEPAGKKWIDKKPASLDFVPGDLVHGFRILSEVGRGSFAVVYQAEEMALGRKVALKVSHGSQEEAKLLASLEHDHIVRVFSEKFDEEKHLRLVCMQLVPGATFEQVLRQLEAAPPERWTGEGMLEVAETLSPLPVAFHSSSLIERERVARVSFVEATVHLGALLADALGYAHSRGVLHLDVKPSNILVTPFGRPMLADFNISIDKEKLAKEMPEQFGGTANYMSPEQRRVFDDPENPEVRRVVSARSDIYSLGVVLKELVAFAELRTLPHANSAEIGHVLDKATRENPAERYQTGPEMADALRACLEVFSFQRQLPPLNRITSYAEQHPCIALTVIGAVPQLIASVVGILYNNARIISHLSFEQKVTFDRLNQLYNPVLYAVVTFVWVVMVKRAVSSPHRRVVLRLPEIGFILTSLSWLPSAAIFAYALNVTGSGIGKAATGHLILSFVLSWMIAASYCYLLHLWIVLRNLYVQKWVGETEIGRIAKSELSGIGRRAKMCLRWIILIPLLGTSMLLGFSNASWSSTELDSFRYLGVLLVAMSGSGVYIAASLGAQLQKILSAFSRD